MKIIDIKLFSIPALFMNVVNYTGGYKNLIKDILSALDTRAAESLGECAKLYLKTEKGAQSALKDFIFDLSEKGDKESIVQIGLIVSQKRPGPAGPGPKIKGKGKQKRKKDGTNRTNQNKRLFEF